MPKSRMGRLQKIEALQNIFNLARTRELECKCPQHELYGRLTNDELDFLEKLFTDTRKGFPFIMGLVAITIAKNMEANTTFMQVYEDELNRK